MKQGIIISLIVVLSVVGFLCIVKVLSDAHYAEVCQKAYTKRRNIIEDKLATHAQSCREKIVELRNRLCMPLGIGNLSHSKPMKEFIERSCTGDYGTDPAATSAKITELIQRAYPHSDASAIYDRLVSRINEQRDEVTIGRLRLAAQLVEYERWRKSDAVPSEFGAPSNKLIAVTSDDKVLQGQDALDSMVALARESTLVDDMQPIVAKFAAECANEKLANSVQDAPASSPAKNK